MPYDIIIGRDDSDKKRFGEKGLVFLGKGYVTMGNYTSLSNLIWLDVARTHVIMIAGKRGSGKCLSGDTLINLSDGSCIPIKELENNKQKIISLNNQLKIQDAEKSEFFSREVNKMLKIKLRSGKEIKLTPEHPLLTIKGWIPVEELKIGNRIATPRKISSFGNNEIPEHEIKLLSYLIAEGHTKKVVLFSNSDEKIVNDFKEALNKFDHSLKLIKEQKDNYRISQPNWKNKILDKTKIKRNSDGTFSKGSKIINEKRSIRKLIEKYELFGKLAIQKNISQNIMKLKKEQLVLFLNRLFSCDGSIYQSNNYWEISYSSSSKKLIKQVQNLLLRFSILSKLRTKKIKHKEKEFESFELVLNSENVIRFVEQIGFFGEKEKRIEEAVKNINSKIRNTNIDTIPKEIWETYKPKNWAEIGRFIGYKHPKAMRERIKYSPSRQTLLQIAKAEQNNPLQLLATSDIFWDEIISIELLEGKFKVYDLCVPELHNFIANDIIVHNSYTLGSIAEELSDLPPEVAQNIAPIIFDTMGIFWTMKYKNEKESELLQSWDLKPKNLPVTVWVPFGHVEDYKKRQIPVDKTFALKPNELTAEDWILTFKLGMTDSISILIQKSLSEIKKDFDLDELIEKINSEKIDDKTKNATASLFAGAKTWGIFADKDQKGTKVSELISPGKTTILDLSVYSSIGTFNVRALVIGLLSKKLFRQRMLARKKEEIEALQHGVDYMSYSEKRETPLIWIFIDEAHEFLPQHEKTPATDALIQLLREGRQPGISLVLATQQPGVIHRDAMTQSDIVIAHRVTAQPDIEALNSIMQTYLLSSIRQSMGDLPHLKGSALILDDNSERIYPMRIKPRFTWHGGEAPTAVKVERRL